MPEKYKYFVTSPLTDTIQTYPTGKAKIVWEKNTEDFRHDYSEKISNNLTFFNDQKNLRFDFDFFYTLETSPQRCEWFYLSIHKLCDGLYIPDWKTGRINLNQGKWDLNRCKVTFTIDSYDKFACYDDHKDDDFNIFDVSSRVTVNLVQGTVETTICNIENLVHIPDPCPVGTAWVKYYLRILYNFTPPDPGRFEEDWYARYNLGNGTYIPAVVYNPITTTDAEGATITQYQVAGIDGPTTIDNGVLLKDVVQALLDMVCPGLTVRSDFFQWNALAPTLINYVTGQATLVNNLILFQKSDVKRPDVSNDATLGILNFETLLANICTMFNTRWDIVGTDFIIEHLSWWGNTAGLDLTLPRYYDFMRFSNRYSYNRGEMPKYENFTFMEAANGDFIGRPIWYDSPCVSNDKDTRNKDYKADIITTDINFVLSNPLDDKSPDFNGLVSDEGFCLIACDADNNIITLPGILSDTMTNNSLSWAYLHLYYYKHGRVLLEGYMNNVLTEFVSAIKTRVQDKIKIPFCCGDTFIPTDLITTFLANDGEVKTASYDINEEMLELTLVIGNEGLIILELVARSDSFTVPWNTTSILNILANDTATAGLDVTSVVIVQDPVNGVAVVNIDGTISYTPTTDYLGPDFLKYTVKDLNGVVSNVANVYITVVKTCTGDAPVITSIVRNDDNSITVTGTAVLDSIINLFGSTTETGLFTQINGDFTQAEFALGITLPWTDIQNYTWIKAKSINADCDFGYSISFEMPAEFLVTWQGVPPQICLTDSFGSNTGYYGYETRARYINGIADGYTEPNTEGTGIGVFIPPVYDVTACPPYVDENPVFFNAADETKVILWTAQQIAKYGSCPHFQVWVYNITTGQPELTSIGLDADEVWPDMTTYTYHNAAADGYIIKMGRPGDCADMGSVSSGGSGGVVGDGSTTLERMTWMVEGFEREAIVYQPTGTNLPILFAFHGRNGTGAGFSRKHFENYLPGWIVVYPTGLPTLSPTATGWQHSVGEVNPYTGVTDQDLKFYDAMLTTFGPSIDPAKVFVHGWSNGGEFIYDVLWVARDTTLNSMCSGSAILNTTSGKTAKPVLHIAGETDPLVPFATQQTKFDDIKTLNGCTGSGTTWASGANGVVATEFACTQDSIFLQYSNGHPYPDNVIQLIAQFFIERL